MAWVLADERRALGMEDWDKFPSYSWGVGGNSMAW